MDTERVDGPLEVIHEIFTHGCTDQRVGEDFGFRTLTTADTSAQNRTRIGNLFHTERSATQRLGGFTNLSSHRCSNRLANHGSGHSHIELASTLRVQVTARERNAQLVGSHRTGNGHGVGNTGIEHVHLISCDSGGRRQDRVFILETVIFRLTVRSNNLDDTGILLLTRTAGTDFQFHKTVFTFQLGSATETFLGKGVGTHLVPNLRIGLAVVSGHNNVSLVSIAGEHHLGFRDGTTGNLVELEVISTDGGLQVVEHHRLGVFHLTDHFVQQRS